MSTNAPFKSGKPPDGSREGIYYFVGFMQDNPSNASPPEVIEPEKAMAELNNLLTRIDEAVAKPPEGEGTLSSSPAASDADKSA